MVIWLNGFHYIELMVTLKERHLDLPQIVSTVQLTFVNGQNEVQQQQDSSSRNGEVLKMIVVKYLSLYSVIKES